MLIKIHLRCLRSDTKPTLDEIQGLVFCSGDVLFSPGWWPTWLIVFYQEVRAADLKKRKQKYKDDAHGVEVKQDKPADSH